MRQNTKNRGRILSLLICAALLFSTLGGNFAAFAADTPVFEDKVYSRATAKGNFDGSSVLVVLDKSISDINKRFDDDFFGNFKKEYVKDLTRLTGDVSNKKYLNYDEFRQIFEIKLPGDSKENVVSAIRQLEKVPGIKYAGPNRYWSPSAVYPDDESFTNPGFGTQYNLPQRFAEDPELGPQWYLKKINAPEAWEITKGSRDVKVGVIDTGIGYTYENDDSLSHSDLNDNVDKELAFDFMLKDSYRENDGRDEDGHGSMVSGVLGAAGNNEEGITGACWEVDLVPLKIAFSAGGHGFIDVFMIEAIIYAFDKDIPILNHSWTLNGSDVMYDNHSFETALAMYDGLYVCAAGNTPALEFGAQTPAVFPGKRTISVSSSDENDDMSWFSAYSGYHDATVDLFAPGENILTTTTNQTYTTVQGTSFAAPLVAGTAALILSQHEGMPAETIKQAILESVDEIPALDGWCETGGRLNAYAALQRAEELAEEPIYEYEINDLGNNEAEIVGPLFTPSGSLIIPSIIEGKTITAIGSGAFQGCDGLGSVTIPDSIYYIGDNAFYGCTSLTTVYVKKTSLSGGITALGANVFSGCSLTAIYVPDSNSVTAYKNATNWSTHDLIIQLDSATQVYGINYHDVGGSAFSGTHGSNYPTTHTYGAVTNLDAPTKTGYFFNGWFETSNGTGSPKTTLGATEYNTTVNLYAKWTAITYTVIYDANEPAGQIATGSTPNSDHTYGTPKALTANGFVLQGFTFTGWKDASGKSYKDKEQVNNLRDTSGMVTLYAQWKSGSGGSFIPTDGLAYTYDSQTDSYTVSIGAAVAEGIIRIPATYDNLPVTGIDDYGFYDCYGVDCFEFEEGSSIEAIGDYAFAWCTGLENFNIPSGVTHIGEYAFAYCLNFTSVTIPQSAEYVGFYAFFWDTAVTIYSGTVDSFGWDANWNALSRPTVWGCALEGGYVVSFNTNGISNFYSSDIYAPYREGYDCAGWTTIQNGDVLEYACDELEGVPAATVLYAIWIPE